MSRRNNMFKHVPTERVKRNRFDLSHEVKTTAKFGTLYPCLLLDTLPGDRISDQVTVFLRMAPMLAPIYHRIDVTFHAFFVPCRLLMQQDLWETFITAGGAQGNVEVILPYLRPDTIAAAGGGAGADAMRKGSLWDYLGLPLAPATPAGGWSQQKISVLPFRACAKVWNDFYRDPNIAPSTELDLGLELQGNVSTQSYDSGILTLYQRGWEKDYFTSCLPWAQRGTEVLMPLSGVAFSEDITYSETATIVDAAGDPMTPDRTLEVLNSQPGVLQSHNIAGGTWVPSGIQNIDSIRMENSATSINDLRVALALQSYFEANARGGGRYNENIESQFNVRVPDYRLQRCEYLGGGRQVVNISEVLATANTDVDTNEIPVGDLFGHGMSAGKSNRFSYFCQEHGFVVGFLSVMPVPAYDLGIERLWSREKWYDFGWPKLAHLGEQEVKSKEVFFSFDQADAEDNEELFGYIPRFSEYKFKQDRVTGDFRDTLAFWHLVRKFTERPVLDDAFLSMEENGDGEETFRRIFAVQDGTDYLWINMFHRIDADRPLPYFGVPRLVG